MKQSICALLQTANEVGVRIWIFICVKELKTKNKVAYVSLLR